MTGWNMPPGVNERDIPGNRPEDLAIEALYDAIYDKLEALRKQALERDERHEKLAEWFVEQMSEAYEQGYSQGISDERMANEWSKNHDYPA